MLDAMSMDQLRTFIAAADEGSFSAAGRKLRRAQSVVSTTLANLEQQVGFALFERTGRYPQLTEAGRALLEQARSAVGGMDAFKARARTLAEGLEPELAVAVDVMFPIATLTTAVQAFKSAFPTTPLRLYVEALGAVVQPLVEGNCRVAIIGSLPEIPPGCASEFLLSVTAVCVVAPCHPLAAAQGQVPQAQAAQHVQLVLTDRSTLTAGRNFGVVAAQTWRLADLGAKHAFLRAGLGWGYMPLHMVEDDLRTGKLARIELEAHAPLGPGFSMHAIHMRDHPPGPAGRWFVNRLKLG
ncbi:LysR family transcriptional regulator [Duganella sp. BJB488]|uniref:LysR family transcriptional regulator n=1 Tax=unclassified Duganella TaxID=2636909 RepID=UPI000E353954|nr:MULTISPECIES: LysR family transcriptional regulator [unclassified Duganella]RFP23042.1 LysR family transcriptional regulator [Duganella sp. BJB489]RFP24881.1 LysR family transcriptional regulator [Duganella sp. BJB488]RFP34042.1 LysR family transcriptional regulator [Duganella sp. BJB480]